MNEAETMTVGRNIIDWKHEASQQAISAASQAADVATSTAQSAEAAMTRGADQQREFVRESARSFGEARRDLGQGSAEKMHTLLSFASMTQGGLLDLQDCLTGLLEGVVRTNLRLAQEIFLVESPRAFAELQQRFLREYFDAFQEGAAALIHATSHPEKVSI
jgi:hypothetical protein